MVRFLNIYGTNGDEISSRIVGVGKFAGLSVYFGLAIRRAIRCVHIMRVEAPVTVLGPIYGTIS